MARLDFDSEDILGKRKICLGDAAFGFFEIVKAHGLVVHVQGVVSADVLFELGGALDVNAAVYVELLGVVCATACVGGLKCTSQEDKVVIDIRGF